MRSWKTRLAILFALVGLAGLAFAVPATSGGRTADGYPARPIKLIVPYPPGGGVDVVARIIARKLGDVLGQQVIVDNKPGASTIIGTDALAKASPDGYTLGLVTDSHAINAAFGRKLPYDSVRDFTPIGQLINVPFVLLARPGTPYSNIHELVQYAKANPGRVTFASLGPGSPHQLAMEWFKKSTGTDIQLVVYKGIAPALTDTVGGVVDIMFSGAGVADGYVAARRLKVLGHTSPRPAPEAHGNPIDNDVPGFRFTTWYAMAAPAKVPREVVLKLNEALAVVLRSPDVASQLASLGALPSPGTPEQMKELIQVETQKWSRIIKDTGAKDQ